MYIQCVCMCMFDSVSKCASEKAKATECMYETPKPITVGGLVPVNPLRLGWIGN